MRYVCECGNTLDATFVEESWEGPTGTVVVLPGSVECRSEKHDSPNQMKRQNTEES